MSGQNADIESLIAESAESDKFKYERLLKSSLKKLRQVPFKLDGEPQMVGKPLPRNPYLKLLRSKRDEQSGKQLSHFTKNYFSLKHLENGPKKGEQQQLQSTNNENVNLEN